MAGDLHFFDWLSHSVIRKQGDLIFLSIPQLEPVDPPVISDRISALPIFLWMLQAMHYSNPLKIIHLAAVLLSVVPAGLTILAPVEIFLGYYEIYRYLIVLAALYTIYVISQGIRSRKPGAEIIVLAFSFLVAGTLVEVFWGVDRNPYSVAFSTLAMIGLFLLVQIEKFHTIYTIKENLETEIILDQLTGAFNRQYLELHLEQINLEYERHAQPLSLILMDLDHSSGLMTSSGMTWAIKCWPKLWPRSRM